MSLLQVVDEHATQAKPEPKNHRTHILKSDWFWYTIQNGYADEMDYLFGDVSRNKSIMQQNNIYFVSFCMFIVP